MRDDIEKLIIGASVIFSFDAMFWYILTHGISDLAGGTTVALLAGSLTTGFGTVVGWYFTSRRPAQSNGGDIAEPPAPSPPVTQ